MDASAAPGGQPGRSERLVAVGGLRLDLLGELLAPPEPWAPGEPAFWDLPHIAGQMLAAHLDRSTKAASAPPEVIDATVAWITERLGLRAGDSLVDLECGPGLYTRRFADRGLKVTGIDLSPNSIEYARSHDRLTTYRCENYLHIDDTAAFDVATLIYGDYCTFDDADRAALLGNVHRALVAGGRFVLDVSTAAHHAAHNCGNGWSVSPAGGFWKPGPHLVLTRHHRYPDLDLALCPARRS